MDRSPFPGMDPYLESHWADVHPTMIVYGRSSLQRELRNRGSDVRGRINQREIDVDAADLRDLDPLVLSMSKQRFIELADRNSEDSPITVIEFLSPYDKLRPNARSEIIRRRTERLAAGTNVVEIDLIRSGTRNVPQEEVELPAPLHGVNLTCVFRAEPIGRCEVWAMPLRDRLPTIAVPVTRSSSDRDLALDIQWLIDTAYSDGAYGRFDHLSPCRPPLSHEDQGWADDLMRRAGWR